MLLATWHKMFENFFLASLMHRSYRLHRHLICSHQLCVRWVMPGSLHVHLFGERWRLPQARLKWSLRKKQMVSNNSLFFNTSSWLRYLSAIKSISVFKRNIAINLQALILSDAVVWNSLCLIIYIAVTVVVLQKRLEMFLYVLKCGMCYTALTYYHRG